MSHEDGHIQGNQDPREISAGEPAQPLEVGASADGQSRRVFLRNAVIGSAAAAAAVGVGAVVASRPVGPKLLGRVVAFNSLASPGDPYAICFESTELLGSDVTGFTVSATGKNGAAQSNPGSFWLFYTARALPAGNYTLVLQQSVNGGAGTDVNFGSAPFGWQNANGSVNTLVTTSAVADCPTAVGGSGGSSYGPVPAVAGDTIQWAVHLTWNGGNLGPAGTHETITLTGSLSGVIGSSRTTATITVTQV